MDKMLNSKRETESIYEIYRACRLCGGGAGYKMPIIQNIVDLDDADVELKQKIRDCVQIEVHQDDKMPPLICELCVDKVNDFYEFLEMCRQTNKRTRLRLGLPPQSMPRGAPDAGDCILGLTEPVFVNEDSDGEPLSKHKKLSKSSSKLAKREPVVRIKIENLQDGRSKHKSLQAQRKNKREPTPPRITRHRSKDEDIPSVKDQKSKSSKPAPKSILKRQNSIKNEEPSLMPSRLKRARDEPVKFDTTKKVNIKSSPPRPSKISPRISPRITSITKPKPSRVLRSPPPVTSPKREPSPPKLIYSCVVCGQQHKSSQARGNHMRSHVVTYTNPKLACNPCEEWFPTADEYASHHRIHKNKHMPYPCWKCQSDFNHLSEYDKHFENNECLPSTEVPDFKCVSCWHLFPTYTSLEDHKCLGENYRPGGNCSKCNKSYVLLKTLRKHESSCTAKKKGDFISNKHLLDQLRPIQVRVARCDPLLVNVKQGHYDVSCVSPKYGLDRNRYYPYISGLKSSGMVSIEDEIKNVFCAEDYIHWDSSEDSDDEVTCDVILNPSARQKKVNSLAALSLKTIFSQRFLGKVPKKKKKVKVDKAFDYLLDDDDVKMDISNLINNLGDDDIKSDAGNKSDCSFDLLSSYGHNVSHDVSSDKDDDKVNDDIVKDNDNCTNNDNRTDLNKDNAINDNSIDSNDKEELNNENVEPNLEKENDKQNLEDYKFDNDVINSTNIKNDNGNVNDNSINDGIKFKISDMIQNNDNCNDNEKVALDDLLSKGESKGLGINDFSFDTI